MNPASPPSPVKRRSKASPSLCAPASALACQRVVVGLREIDQSAIVAEIIVAQLRKTIEAEALDDQPLEMAGEEIGEEERAGLRLHHRVEIRLSGIEGVAMRAGDARHAFLRQHAVELAARAAIAVEAEDFVVAGAVRADLAAHRLGDAFRPVVQLGGQAGHVEGAERAVAQREDFARQRAAGDHQHAARAVDPARKVPLDVRLVGLHAIELHGSDLDVAGVRRPALARSPAGARASPWRSRPRPPRRGNRRRRRWRRRRPR